MIDVLSYYLLIMVVMILNHFDIITDTVTMALFFAVNVLVILGMFVRLSWLSRRAGGIIIELNKYWITEFFSIGIIAVTYFILILVEISRPNINHYMLMIIMSFFPLYVVLLSIFSKNFIGKKGVVYDGKIVTWNRIETYRWIESKYQLRKGFSKLLIKIKPTFFLGEITLKIKNTQKSEIDLLLHRIINLKETANDR